MKISLAVSTLMAVGGVVAGMVIGSPTVTLADSNDGQTVQSTTDQAPTPVATPDPSKQPKQEVSNPPVTPEPKPGHLEVKWQGDSLTANWQGSCDSPVSIKIGAENWGYLPEPKDGIQAISGTSSGNICDPENGGNGVSIPLSQAVCYGFTKAWIQIDGKTDDAGLKVLEIPSGITCSN
jgi:hypothetical protein